MKDLLLSITEIFKAILSWGLKLNSINSPILDIKDYIGIAFIGIAIAKKMLKNRL